MAEKILFSFEVPLKHLDDFEPYQDFHFAISTHCIDRNYIDFYKSHTELGLKTVWLDNGFNETKQADDPHDLIYYMREMGAIKVFSPDDIEWEYSKIEQAYETMTRHLGHKSVIPVLRNMDFYERFSKTHPTTVVAVPFRRRPDGVSPEWNNGQLIDLCSAEWVHYLGLNNIEELEKTRPNSCDTSIPIKLAMIKKSTLSWAKANCPRIHRADLPKDFFNCTLTTKEIDDAIKNIQQLKKIING